LDILTFVDAAEVKIKLILWWKNKLIKVTKHL